MYIYNVCTYCTCLQYFIIHQELINNNCAARIETITDRETMIF